MGIKAHDEDENLAAMKKVSVSTSVDNSQVEKGDWLKYSRDTYGLGKKSINNVNVYTQCDIKIAASHYRVVQKQVIEFRLENEKLKANEVLLL